MILINLQFPQLVEFMILMASPILFIDQLLHLTFDCLVSPSLESVLLYSGIALPLLLSSLA